MELCKSLINLTVNDEIPQCDRKNCQFLHDIDEYLKTKPKDIGESCYNYRTFGRCNRGLTCRFGSEHITENGRNKVNNTIDETVSQTENHLNLKQDLQVALRKRTYNFDLSAAIIDYNDRKRKEFNGNQSETTSATKSTGCITDEDIVRLTSREKRRINWSNKLFLSPLTTVGNLPFRRICKEFGADVTCGEMAMCSSLLQGSPQEWALVKRHKTEDVFGVQLCANNPHLLTRCGQLLQQETNIDFIDLNLGCPIELVYRDGGGCGLLRRTKVLEACITNLSQILTIPLTVKTRTGVYTSEKIAHTLVHDFLFDLTEFFHLIGF